MFKKFFPMFMFREIMLLNESSKSTEGLRYFPRKSSLRYTFKSSTVPVAGFRFFSSFSKFYHLISLSIIN